MKGEERKRKGSEDNPQEEAWNEAKGSDWSVGCETVLRQKSWCSVTASLPSSLPPAISQSQDGMLCFATLCCLRTFRRSVKQSRHMANLRHMS